MESAANKSPSDQQSLGFQTSPTFVWQAQDRYIRYWGFNIYVDTGNVCFKNVFLSVGFFQQINEATQL